MGWGMEHMEVAVAMAIMPRMTAWGATDLLLVFTMRAAGMFQFTSLKQFVLTEKTFPQIRWLSLATGATLIAWEGCCSTVPRSLDDSGLCERTRIRLTSRARKNTSCFGRVASARRAAKPVAGTAGGGPRTKSCTGGPWR